MIGLHFLLFLISFMSCNGQTYPACGRTFNGSSGSMNSPNYPSDYYSYWNCTFFVSASSSSSIVFTIQDISLEPNARCDFDWVELSCLSNSASLPMRYCGTGSNVRPITFSPCTRASLWFRTDGYVVRRGFLISYEIRPTDDNSSLTVPTCGSGCNRNYNRSYCYCPLNDEQTTTSSTCNAPGCSWYYDFLDRRSCRCSSTTSRVESTQPPLQCPSRCYLPYTGARYCVCLTTTRSPPCYTPCYNRWSSTSGQDYCFCPTTTTRPPSIVCGSTYRGMFGTIASPNYPNVYPRPIDCYQYISVPTATSIRLKILDLNVYYSDSLTCFNDYVQVTGCDDSITTFCTSWRIPSSGLNFDCTESKTVTIRFHSSSSSYSSYRGFKMEYIANSQSNCSTNSDIFLTPGSSGFIHSPKYPYNFPLQSECYNYIIVYDDDVRIKITFDTLSLGSYSTCRSLFIRLTCVEGGTANQTICGPDNPKPMTFDCRILQIWFSSSLSVQPYSQRYFRLRYFAIGKYNDDFDPERPGSFPYFYLAVGLGAGLGAILFISVIICISCKRHAARNEQRHLEDLTMLCRTMQRGSGWNMAENVDDSTSVGGEPGRPVNHGFSGQEDPPPYLTVESVQTELSPVPGSEVEGRDERMLIA